jgi:senataxin
MTDRQKLLIPAKKHRAPVEAPKTNAFGKPLDETGKVIEPPRPPPKKVEESSSSESESDDEVGGLFSIAKENKSPPKIRKTEQRKVQLLNEPMRSRISMQARDREQGRVPSERNIRARLQPDTKPLITRVLGWMPEHTGQFPPGMTQGDFKKVATIFPSPNKYEETYEPLLMLECWQHILQAKMESLAESFDFTIENRQRTDEYVDLFVTMKPMTYAKINLMEPDLVIISNNRGRGGKECFALVKGHKKKWDSVELSLRCIPPRDLAALLVPKTAMFGTKLFRFAVEELL